MAAGKVQPWNKGCVIGQKPALTQKQVWDIRMNLIKTRRRRDLALLNLAIDSKLVGDDLVCLRVRDIRPHRRILDRATVIQHRTGRPVKFEITDVTRKSLENWIAEGKAKDYLFPSRSKPRQQHISTRQYARIVNGWVESIGLDGSIYGTHSLRRTKVAIILETTGDLLACQRLLGHKRMDTTIKYLGVTVADAEDRALDVAKNVNL